MPVPSKGTNWYDQTPSQRLERRKHHALAACAALLSGLAWTYFRAADGWVWLLFAIGAYGVTCLAQVVVGRESFWLDRAGMLGGGLVGYYGWRLTGDRAALLAMVASLLALVADITMHKARTG